MEALSDLLTDPQNFSTVLMLGVLLIIPLFIFLWVLFQMARGSKNK